MGNISKRHEMPLQGTLVVQLSDVWGMDFMGPFPASFGNIYIQELWIMYQNGLRQQLVPKMMLTQLWDFYKEIFSTDLGHPEL